MIGLVDVRAELRRQATDHTLAALSRGDEQSSGALFVHSVDLGPWPSVRPQPLQGSAERRAPK